MSFPSFPNPINTVFQIQPSIENAFNKYFLDCEHERTKLKISSFIWGHWMSQILDVRWSDRKAWRNLNCKNSMGGSGLVTKLFPTFETPWTVAHQAPLSMEFFRQEYWSGLPFPSPGDLPDPRIETASPALQADSLPLSHQGSPSKFYEGNQCKSLWKIF